MEVEEEEVENISAEAMKALYNKSVSVPPVATMPAGSPSLNQVKPLSGEDFGAPDVTAMGS